MADDPSEKPSNDESATTVNLSDKKIFIGLGVLFLLIAIAYGMSLGPIETPESQEATAEEVSATEDQVEEIERAYSDGSSAEPAETMIEVGFDLENAKKERILGDPFAPIKITEHSSLTCGHCGRFHRETFKAFQAEYIDTGKAYLVFSDFPLNAPALHATMAARCISDDTAYFNFLQVLFETQDDWAADNNYLQFLENTAARFGLDKATFTACVQNQDLQDTLLKRMQAVQSQWEVRKTPSFVVNNQKVITGSLPLDAFVKAIQEAVAQIEAKSSPQPVNAGE